MHTWDESYEPRITEDMQIQCLARFGSVFQKETGGERSEYWVDVWNWLRVQYRDLCNKPDLDYPMDSNGGDIELLNEIFNWQNVGRKI